MLSLEKNKEISSIEITFLMQLSIISLQHVHSQERVYNENFGR